MLSGTDRWIFSRACAFLFSPRASPLHFNASPFPAFFGFRERSIGLPRIVYCGREVCPKSNHFVSIQIGYYYVDSQVIQVLQNMESPSCRSNLQGSTPARFSNSGFSVKPQGKAL